MSDEEEFPRFDSIDAAWLAEATARKDAPNDDHRDRVLTVMRWIDLTMDDNPSIRNIQYADEWSILRQHYGDTQAPTRDEQRDAMERMLVKYAKPSKWKNS